MLMKTFYTSFGFQETVIVGAHYVLNSKINKLQTPPPVSKFFVNWKLAITTCFNNFVLKTKHLLNILCSVLVEWFMTLFLAFLIAVANKYHLSNAIH